MGLEWETIDKRQETRGEEEVGGSEGEVKMRIRDKRGDDEPQVQIWQILKRKAATTAQVITERAMGVM